MPRPSPSAAGHAADAPTPAHPAAALALLCLAVILVQAMVAGINLALPTLAASDLHLSRTALVWVVDTYIVAFAGLLIPAGAFGDRFGRKGTLTAGLAVFAAACLLGAFAPNTAVLITSRAVAGASAALVQPATLSLCLHVSPPQRRAHAIALWTAALGAGGLVGNLAAGVILQFGDWQAFFAAFAPPAALLALLCAVVVPRVPRHRATSLDPAGSALLVAGLVALLFGVIEGPARGWADAAVLAGFAASVVLVSGFVLYALRARGALLDPRVFRLPMVRSGSVGVAAGFLGLFGLFFANAQFLQGVKGYSAIQTGFAILPLPLVMAVLSRRAVGFVNRFGARPVIGTGLVLIAAGLLAVSFVGRGTPYALYALCLVVLASGAALSGPALTGGILGGLPPERAGLGSGLNSAAREIGAAVGVALVGTIINSRGGLAEGLGLGYRVLAGVVVVLTVPVLAWWRPARGTAAAAGPARPSDAPSVPVGDRVA